MYLLLVFLPLLSAVCCASFGRFLGKPGVTFVSIFLMGLSSFLSMFIFYEVSLSGYSCWLELSEWMFSEHLRISWSFLFDPLTSVMLVVVSLISFLVHLYSLEYMGADPHFARFMSYISLFTFFMYILISADNMVQMFVGWEGVGLCSYLLINFWFSRIQANKAAIKAMLVNRVGDFALTLGIFCCFLAFSTLSYSSLFTMAPLYTNYSLSVLGFSCPLIDIACSLLFLGAMGKSAQLGLHMWLPDAMEGPTPVSALIHAATMVTAGVFFVARCSPLFEFSPITLSFICVIGALTAFFSATTGLAQNDLKRVIAYSTCSQLGYMVFACGLSCYDVSVFHLYNHAFFKALLFLGAGSVIHGVADEQDMRRMGGLRRLMPLTYSVMLTGSLALMGFPFLSGFYSKDIILEAAYGKYSWLGFFSYTLGLMAALCTSFYSTRLLYLTFLAEPSGNRRVIVQAHESPWQMYVPLLALVFPSMLMGYLSKDFFIGLGSDGWGGSIFVLPSNYVLIASEFAPIGVKLLPFFFSLFGFTVALYLYGSSPMSLYFFKTRGKGRWLYNFLNRKWLFDRISSELVSQGVLSMSLQTSYRNIDRGVVEVFGPLGAVKLLKEVSFFIRYLHSGLLYQYSLVLLVGLALFLFLVVSMPSLTGFGALMSLLVVLLAATSSSESLA